MRYLEKHIINDLKTKIVFLSGPRQVGKTFLAKTKYVTVGYTLIDDLITNNDLLNLIDQSINYFLWVYTLVSGIFSVVSMILAISLISWRQGRQLKMSFWRS